jgi:hypothetical protein
VKGATSYLLAISNDSRQNINQDAEPILGSGSRQPGSCPEYPIDLDQMRLTAVHPNEDAAQNVKPIVGAPTPEPLVPSAEDTSDESSDSEATDRAREEKARRASGVISWEAHSEWAKMMLVKMKGCYRDCMSKPCARRCR